jgi:hypothetical protein
MKNLVLSTLLAMASLSIFNSCAKENSEDVNQDKIYTTYELFYNANSDKTVAVAKFRFGGATGTILELTSGANVTFNGDDMTYNGWYAGHVKEYAGMVTSGSFVYTDVDGNTFTNTALSMDTAGYENGFDTIVKSQANTFTWTGNALAANESISLFVGSWTWGEDALFHQAQDNATNLIMGVNQMTNLAEGTSTVYMNRTNLSTSIDGTSEGGWIKSTYRPVNVDVTVVP